MIDSLTIQTPRGFAARATIARPPAVADHLPAPPTPPDVIDFGHIDKPEVAAVLPVLEPAVQVAVAAGVILASVAGSQGGAVPHFVVRFFNQVNGQEMHGLVHGDLSKPQHPLSGGGVYNGYFVASDLKVDAQKQSAAFHELIGGNENPVDLALNADGQKLHVNGKMGTVDVDLHFSSATPSKKDGSASIHAEGKLGGQDYVLDTTIESDASGKSKMVSRGKLGEAAISKDYEIVSKQDGGNVRMSIKGSGTIAGRPESVQVDLGVSSKK